MKYYINDVTCDTFTHIDDKRTGETVAYFASDHPNGTITVFLFVNGKPWPLGAGCTAQCCMINAHDSIDGTTYTAQCTIGSSGEVIIPLPSAVLVEGKTLFCEIVVSFASSATEQAIYRTANFRVVICDI